MAFGWHPREHRKALDGMLMLTLEERGAYNTCLDLIYDREGPIPDDARWLAGWMGVSSKKWAKIRATLVFKGKLFEVNLNGQPSLMNQRAAIELENQSNRARNSRESGAKGGRTRVENAGNTNKINDPAQATLEGSLKLKTETQTKTEENPVEPNGSPPPKKARGSRRCPEAWTPAAKTLADLGAEGFSPGDLERALTRMRDHEFRTARTDWDAALRNWVRSDADRKPRNDRPHHDAKFNARQANLATLERGADLAARLHGKP